MSTVLRLSPRERQVAGLIARGFSSPYIARKLHLSIRTIDTHKRHIYQKLEVSTRDDLIEQYAGRI